MKLKTCISKFLYSIPFVEDVYLSCLLFFIPNINKDDNKRHLRVRVLKFYVHKLSEILKKMDFRHEILINKDEVLINLDGVFLNAKGTTNRYFKLVKGGNEGKDLHDFLYSKGITVNSMIDLGANFGEISLYFALRNPQAKILSIEASGYNFKILESNRNQQYFDTSNVYLIHEAVSDFAGEVKISKGLGAENSIILYGQDNFELVKTDTLKSLVDRYGLKQIDFLKIDIEGAEPLLFESLSLLSDNIRAIHLEVGDKRDHRDYLQILEFLFSSQFKCYTMEDEEIVGLDILTTMVLNNKILNLWFIKNKN